MESMQMHDMTMDGVSGMPDRGQMCNGDAGMDHSK
jgi:hypothetical protein